MNNRQSDYTNSGALFTNDRRVKETQPSYKGECEIECPHCHMKTSFWMSAWIKAARSGAKFFSIAYSVKDMRQVPNSAYDDPLAPDDKKAASAGRYSAGPKARDEPPMDFDDDVPF